MASPGCAFIAGFDQRGEILLANATDIKLVDGGRKFFQILVALRQREFLQPCNHYGGENRYSRTEEGVQHIMQQVVHAAGDLLWSTGVKMVQADHQAIKRPDDPDPRQNAGQMFEEFGVKWNIDQLLF